VVIIKLNYLQCIVVLGVVEVVALQRPYTAPLLGRRQWEGRVEVVVGMPQCCWGACGLAAVGCGSDGRGSDGCSVALSRWQRRKAPVRRCCRGLGDGKWGRRWWQACRGVVGMLVGWQQWDVTAAVVVAVGVQWHCWGDGIAVRRDPKVLRRVSRILIKEALHFANLFYIFK
jgi:hypothetical protein